MKIIKRLIVTGLFSATTMLAPSVHASDDVSILQHPAVPEISSLTTQTQQRFPKTTQLVQFFKQFADINDTLLRFVDDINTKLGGKSSSVLPTNDTELVNRLNGFRELLQQEYGVKTIQDVDDLIISQLKSRKLLSQEELQDYSEQVPNSEFEESLDRTTVGKLLSHIQPFYCLERLNRALLVLESSQSDAKELFEQVSFVIRPNKTDFDSALLAYAFPLCLREDLQANGENINNDKDVNKEIYLNRGWFKSCWKGSNENDI